MRGINKPVSRIRAPHAHRPPISLPLLDSSRCSTRPRYPIHPFVQVIDVNHSSIFPTTPPHNNNASQESCCRRRPGKGNQREEARRRPRSWLIQRSVHPSEHGRVYLQLLSLLSRMDADWSTLDMIKDAILNVSPSALRQSRRPRVTTSAMTMVRRKAREKRHALGT